MTKKKKRTPEWECLECGKLYYSAKTAMRAARNGCSGKGSLSCGGVDIDLYVGADYENRKAS